MEKEMELTTREIYQFPVLQRSELMTVTPEVAAGFLKANEGNRRIRKSHVNALALAIIRGEWVPTHQGIAFNTRGVLIDGQHRLHAIVQANQPVQILVTTGVSENAFQVLDCGVKRKSEDLMQLDQHTSSACMLIGYILKMPHIHNTGSSISAAFALEIANTGVAEISARLIEVCSSRRRYLASTPMRTAAIISVMSGADEEYVFQLYRNLCLYNTNVLPPVAVSLVKQVSAGAFASRRESKMRTLAMGMAVFHKRNQDKTRLAIKPNDISAATALVRDVMAKRGVEIKSSQENAD